MNKHDSRHPLVRNYIILIFLTALIAIGCGGGGGGGSNDGGSNGGGSNGSGSAPGTGFISVTDITENSAVLTVNVYPNGLATNCWFDYGPDNSLTTFTSTPKQVFSDNYSYSVTSLINGLASGTVYYYRLNASNSIGTTKSPIEFFSTFSSGPPTVVTKAATSVNPSGAVLNGAVIPNGFATIAWFEWGINSNLDTYSKTAEQSVGGGYDNTLDNTTLSGLSAGTTYYYRMAASNSHGTTKGANFNFIPSAAPTVTTLAATSVSASGAMLNGEVNPNGLNTVTYFLYGTDPNLGPNTERYSYGPQYLGPSDNSQSVNANLPSLKIGTTYYFRVTASNSSGYSEGGILSFTTVASGPVVGMESALVVVPGSGTATLSGIVWPFGIEATAWFEWSTNSNLDTFSQTAEQLVGATGAGVLINATLTGLSPGSTYYYRIAAKNKFDTSKGTISSFTP